MWNFDSWYSLATNLDAQDICGHIWEVKLHIAYQTIFVYHIQNNQMIKIIILNCYSSNTNEQQLPT
jgi:hypothetical protein